MTTHNATATAAAQAPAPTRKLGGSASSISVGQIAFGLMGMTWCSIGSRTPDTQAFETMKAAADSGATLWNTGAFYGPTEDPYANLDLLKRFFDANPDYKDRVFLSVKGGLHQPSFREKGIFGSFFDSTPSNLEEDLRHIRAHLGTDQGGKQIDFYEMARIDTKVPIEEAMQNLLSLSSQTYTDAKSGQEVRGKGLFHHISISEVGAETIRRAAKAAPLAFVEIEYSPFCRDADELGVVRVCEELQLPILAYSPVGKGMLTGAIKSRADLPEGDMRLTQDKFSEEVRPAPHPAAAFPVLPLASPS
ncbi:uncharacterized protein PFL1_05534 [Pseudozyma flocculosa PF-1]|uniref:NADP-dependent oxidoreductase domain-containing protein n=1 Tax=Pseudozyma flocculosa PF-1 TaxID=1277687 RepID=A0A061H3I7_9BASI|nr:uncharacterized protein PFL1_05534 [Pseudozyma flocculosa PF-1]EPQ26899.1 hypothetical protein PFL1_05534 [Pseudozyma flocculosa PF-1]